MSTVHLAPSLTLAAPRAGEQWLPPLLLGALMVLVMCAWVYLLPTLAWVLMLPLFLVALVSRRWAAAALLAAWLPASLGGALHPALGIQRLLSVGSTVQAGRWLLLAWVTAHSMIFRPVAKAPGGHLPGSVPGLALGSAQGFMPLLLGYALCIALLSLATSVAPVTSLAKIGSWLLGVYGLLHVLGRLNAHEQQWALQWLTGAAGTVVVLSVLVQGLPGSRLTGQQFLRGVLTHSQILGAVAGSLGAYWLCHLFLRETPRQRPLAVLLVLACLIALLMCESRTAMVSAVAGVATALLLHRGAGPFRTQGRAVLVWAGLALLVVAISLSAGSDALSNFLLKHGSSGSFLESLFSTRMEMMKKQLGNFGQNPLFGMGFGVGLPGQVVDLGEGFRWSAPTEKGFLPTAILQETGLVGFILFLLFFAFLVRRLAACADPRLVAAATASLISNFGEASFYSLGGIGYYHWIWIVLALVAPQAPALRRAHPVLVSATLPRAA